MAYKFVFFKILPLQLVSLRKSWKVLDNNVQREKVSDRTSAIIFVLGFQPRAQHPQPEGEVAASLLISLENNQETDENETY
jgi:hypothetical protein